jgi:hypothetical protein
VDRAGTDDAQDVPYDNAPQGMQSAFHGGSIFSVRFLASNKDVQKKVSICGEGAAPFPCDECKRPSNDPNSAHLPEMTTYQTAEQWQGSKSLLLPRGDLLEFGSRKFGLAAPEQ